MLAFIWDSASECSDSVVFVSPTMHRIVATSAGIWMSSISRLRRELAAVFFSNPLILYFPWVYASFCYAKVTTYNRLKIMVWDIITSLSLFRPWLRTWVEVWSILVCNQSASQSNPISQCSASFFLQTPLLQLARSQPTLTSASTDPNPPKVGDQPLRYPKVPTKSPVHLSSDFLHWQ